MPDPAGHRPAVKRKIIDNARKLFNRHGLFSLFLRWNNLSQIILVISLTSFLDVREISAA